MTTAPLDPNPNLTNLSGIDPWKIRDLLIVGIGLPVLFGTMFFVFFFGLGNGN